MKFFPDFSLHLQNKVLLLHHQNVIELWCNGNTTDSGPVILGSNPGSSTEKARKSPRFFHSSSTLLPPRTACFAMRNKQTTLPSDISIITHTWNFNFKIRAVLKTRHQKQTINLHAHPFSVLFYPKPYPTFVLHRRYEEFKWDCARGGLHPQKWRKWKIRQDLKHRIDTKELDARFRLFLEDFGGGF